jgi:GT2 family glycosyltransferase
MDVSIVIVNYNQKNLLNVCLKGIIRIAPKLNYEIIVVDNASKDKSQEMIKNWQLKISNFKYILNEKNKGFGAGCNQGIRISDGKYILILNPDIIVLENSIEKLYEFMEKNKDVGIVGPKLLNPDKTIQSSCYRFPVWYIPILRRTFLGNLSWAKKKIDYYSMSDFDHLKEKDVDWLLGAALMIRKEMLNQIGLFDERFFLYFEDVDLCKRAKIAGFRVVYYPFSEMFHYYQRTSARGIFSLFSKITWIHILSGIKYFLKWSKEK